MKSFSKEMCISNLSEENQELYLRKNVLNVLVDPYDPTVWTQQYN